MRRPVELIVALERECLKVDEAIAKRRWDVCEGSWRAQRLLTHELDIAFAEHKLTEEELAAARKRIDRLTRYRDGQLKRLKAFNEACATRLSNIGRFRSFSKSVGQERRSSLLDVTS
jgi:5-bromo-4-chloroindolyl phosphate hydrolysis protein